jgi:hypothetical protein
VTENQPPKKRPVGRPRRDPMRMGIDSPLKMRAKPNWEVVDVNAPDTPDRLYIAQELIPDGMSAQWVTSSVLGQDVPQHRSQFESRGWTPVHHDDFEGQFNGKFMQKDAPGEITVDGLVLMMRPKQMTDRAHHRNKVKALEQVAIKEQALRGGDMNIGLDATHPSALQANKVNRTMERIVVPEDE